MKTKNLLFLVVSLALASTTFAATLNVTNNGALFVPAEITVQPGDTIIFNITTMHDVVEVSKSTWDANGNTSNGGFSLDYGGGKLILNNPGTYYYVCTPHAVWGMKGVINVSVATGTTDYKDDNVEGLKAVYPNPVTDRLTLNFTLSEPSVVTVDLLDITGQYVKKITHKSFDAGNQVETVDLTFLKPGQYLLRYQSNRKSYIRQLIKVN